MAENITCDIITSNAKIYALNAGSEDMKIYIAGLGPGKTDLITLEALKVAQNSDVIIVPRSDSSVPGIAEKYIARYVSGKNLIPVLFPMINDEAERSRTISEQLISTKTEWENADKIFFPVIGDAMLYSTGAYLLEAFRKIKPSIEAEFIPGISAHSLAASCAKRFLAMSSEILSIIPGTAPPEKIAQILKSSDTAAIYKPKAQANLKNIIKQTGPYEKILRVDFAGIPKREKIFEGPEALENIKEYLSIILLWKS